MKKRTFLYIPLGLLFVFAMSALFTHYANIFTLQGRASREAKLPFGYNSGRVLSTSRDAEAAGIKAGDRIEAIDGRVLESDEVFDEEFAKLRAGQPVVLTMSRKPENGDTEKIVATVTPVKIERNFQYYSGQVVGFIFGYVLPTVCILLGFWVLFVRPADPLAWILLFVLLGLSSLSLEMYWDIGTLAGAYQRLFFSGWALAMLLFGIYFPERWTLDEKVPWLKWIFIVPLSFQILLTLLSILRAFTGVNLFLYIGPLTELYGLVGFVFNMLAIGLFFAALAHKSGTTKNPDARRRLRIMLYGTSVAITPSFLLVLYRIISGAKGSFLEIAPFWIGLITLLLLLLFPLTMAYVIVVQRAMDVSIVVRQGLQYALAKGGVRVLQFFLLMGIGLGVLWSINNYGSNISAQIAFIVGGVALVPLIELVAKPIRVWIDRKFFREAYDSEQLLSELSDDVRTMVETKPLLETLSTRISESLHVPQVALLLKNGTSFQPAHALGYDTPPLASFENDARMIERLRKNEPVVIYQDDEESWQKEDAQDRDKLRELNSQLLLPVGVKNELSGLISLGPKLSEVPYSANDLRLLKSVASQTGLALENSRLTEAIANEAVLKERLNREIEIAREVQERLFPQELPKVEGLEYYGACRPASGVGGDYYDFFELESGKFGIAIGDVSGKGIGASLMMASLQASLRGQAIHSGDDLAGLMVNVNQLVYETSTTNRYATFFYAQYEPSTRKLVYVNAGHNPPFLLRNADVPSATGVFDPEVILLTEGGPVVGMLPPMLVSYKQGEITLQPGDMLVGSTDGITEAMNTAEEEWGEDSMLEAVKKLSGHSSKDIIELIVAEADRFADGAKQHDDMTMIVVRVVR
ncbi:MAG: SpoIIE family protein phosphatase [Saprospiraceae bacterium]|nr:SpoIIE family protein phosphatase [Pyrinomonadaceae bacterium]